MTGEEAFSTPRVELFAGVAGEPLFEVGINPFVHWPRWSRDSRVPE
jgi:hypothetical protein